MNYTTKLNANTKKAKNWIKEYFLSNNYSIDCIYNNASSRKYTIEQNICKKMLENNYKDYRVLSGNSSYFTCGYLSENEDTLYIETFANTYEISLENID